ncbi:MAG: zinc-binding dehydrogenase [Armatimonadaceae bacterium]
MNSHLGQFHLFHGAGQPFTVETMPLALPGDGEILVRVRGCTLCASDLHTVAGHRSAPVPSVLGHEIIGTVEALGKNAPQADANGTPLQVGDRVVWSVAAYCGECRLCRRGITQKCERLFKYGHERWETGQMPDGGLATHCLLRPGTDLVVLPDSLPDTVACLAGCAVATVMAAFRTAGKVAGRVVLVTGTGVLGKIACAVARVRGARVVLASDVSPERLHTAEAFGASHFSLPETLADTVQRASGGQGVDVAIELSGSPQAVESALGLLGIGGTLVLAGTVFPTPPVSFTPETIVRRLLTVRGIHNYATDDLRTAVALLDRTADRFPWESLIAAQYPLSEVESAFAQSLRHPAPSGRVFVYP